MDGIEKSGVNDSGERKDNLFGVVLKCSVNDSGETQCQIAEVRDLPDITPIVRAELVSLLQSVSIEANMEVQSCEESVRESFVERGSEVSQ